MVQCWRTVSSPANSSYLQGVTPRRQLLDNEDRHVQSYPTEQVETAVLVPTSQHSQHSHLYCDDSVRCSHRGAAQRHDVEEECKAWIEKPFRKASLMTLLQ